MHLSKECLNTLCERQLFLGRSCVCYFLSLPLGPGPLASLSSSTQPGARAIQLLDKCSTPTAGFYAWEKHDSDSP